MDTVAFALEGSGSAVRRAIGRFAGIVQHSSCRIRKSVDELLEEGNAFEAEVVKGVEDAEGADEGGSSHA